MDGTAAQQQHEHENIGQVEKRNEMAGRLMVALDYPDAAQARVLMEQLTGIPCYMKVGMQLFYAAGPDFIRELKERGYSVFLDVKMHDIPNTVRGAESLTMLGVDMFNVHAAGGAAMMSAALEGAAKAVSLHPSLHIPLIIAVTQLTSTSQEVMNSEIGINGTVTDTVVRYAMLAAEAGLHGVVASPQESAVIAAACGTGFPHSDPGYPACRCLAGRSVPGYDAGTSYTAGQPLPGSGPADYSGGRSARRSTYHY